jgi:hypothetical protein
MQRVTVRLRPAAESLFVFLLLPAWLAFRRIRNPDNEKSPPLLSAQLGVTKGFISGNIFSCQCDCLLHTGSGIFIRIYDIEFFIGL